MGCARVPIEQPDHNVLCRARARATWAEKAEDLARLDWKPTLGTAGRAAPGYRKLNE
jgi:hypothetical protein